MDNKTLKDLQAAFDAAPSAELAKIITFALIETGNVNDIAPYTNSLGNTLTIEELELVVSAIESSRNHESLMNLERGLSTAACTNLIQLLINKQSFDNARDVYFSAQARDVTVRNAEFDSLLEIEPSGAKLKVVEKANLAEITDLSRYRQKTSDFNDVVGLEKIKKQIHKKIILPFQSPSLFQRFKKKIGGGVLLYGPPGCGKTLLARATAGECNASFFNVEVSDVLDMYIGESEQKLHAIFEKARNETPSVIFFDELEALAGKREHARSSSSANTVSQFLTELDGFSQNNEGILVLASTNVPWAIDSAFLRPGRFDRMFFVPPPDREARHGILKHYIQGRPASADINFNAIANKTSGYSGADLANLVEMAADEAIDESITRGKDVEINFTHFNEALEESRATTLEWLTTARNYARYANDGGRYNDVLDFINKSSKR